MNIITDPTELQRQCLAWRGQGRSIGLVPTMGYLHRGHVSLLDRARPECDRLVASVFVNPAQFGENEDLDSYPRDFDSDRAKAEAHGVDLLFAPEPGAMYETDHATWVEVPRLGINLCGATRPIHFRGVCTVVTKLFMLTQAEVAVFGEKDWQQFAILRRMVRDLNMPVKLIGHPIVREEDGLALSSRNAYLTEAERAAAPNIRKGLIKLAEKARGGERDCAALKRFLADEYAAALPMGEVDYIEIVDPDEISPLGSIARCALAAVAVRMGKARLIDNILIEV
jgi:pantoate--beta-alanine ligase